MKKQLDENTVKEFGKVIGKTIEARRKELKITQEQLAEMIGVHFTTINRLENAKFSPRLELFARVCHALDLFFFVEEKDSKEKLSQLMRDRWKYGEGNEKLN